MLPTAEDCEDDSDDKDGKRSARTNAHERKVCAETKSIVDLEITNPSQEASDPPRAPGRNGGARGLRNAKPTANPAPGQVQVQTVPECLPRHVPDQQSPVHLPVLSARETRKYCPGLPASKSLNAGKKLDKKVLENKNKVSLSWRAGPGQGWGPGLGLPEALALKALQKPGQGQGSTALKITNRNRPYRPKFYTVTGRIRYGVYPYTASARQPDFGQISASVFTPAMLSLPSL
ncbi:hypothetical protein B0H14DRAFT_2565464 [Mycena olivaceomarginata]|nr:hypothetical protein B0H14DRAFT_2565464 [Mycena olivaceomarginata]